MPAQRPLMEATLVERTPLTDAVAFFRLRPDGAPAAFAAGQYLSVGIPRAEGLLERAYSIASSARRLDEGYELYVRLVPGGALTPLLFGARPGDRLTLRRPKGRFTLRPDDDRLHLFVATGCGLAPFMSMLRTLEDDGAPRPAVLLHGVSHADELGYRAEIERLASDPRWSLTYVPTVSRPAEGRNADWRGRTGRVESVLPSLLTELRCDPARTAAYVCGNPEMTLAVERILRGAGFDAGSVHKEPYWPLGR